MRLKYLIVVILFAIQTVLWADTEPNNTCAQAESVSMASLSGTLQATGNNGGDAYDYYRFTTSDISQFSLTTSSLGKNTTITLYNKDCNSVLSTVTGTGVLTLPSVGLDAKAEYVLMLHANANGSNPYTLTPTLTPSIVSEYRMDECSWNGTAGEIIDSEGGNNGTSKSFSSTVATTITDGIINRAGAFKGEGYTADPNNSWYTARYYVEVPDADVLSPLAQTSNMTLTGWFKLNNTTDTHTILHKGGSNQEYRLHVEGGKLYFTVWNQYGSDKTTVINTTLSANKYYFFAVTANITSQTLTLSAQIRYGSNTYSQTNTFNSFVYNSSKNENLYFGATHWSNTNITNFFNGSMDEIKLYNSVLTTNQINTIFNNESSGVTYTGNSRSVSSCTITPIAEYRLDECSWNGSTGEVLDNSSNGYNGALQKKTMILSSGIIGNAPSSFDNDSYVEIPNFPNLTSNMTITAWFKTTDITKAGQRIFEDDQSNSGGYAISVGDGGSGTIRFYDRSQNNSGIIDSDAVLHNNTWYFVAAVTDIANLKRYLYLYNADGTRINQKSSSINNPSRGSDTGVATIGGEPDGGETGNRFKGSIDEVKIFSTPLSQTQIETILSNEKQGLNYDGISRTAVCCCVPSGGNLIANPSFETLCNSNIIATFNNVAGGTARSRSGLCGWEVAYGIETWENTTSPAASDGSVFVELDGASNHIDKIWQTLDTTEDRTYIIQFDYRKRSTSYKEGIIAKWNGIEIASVDGLTTKWQTAQIEVVGTSGLDTLTFEEPAASDDSIGSWIDNIRVIGGAFTTPKRYSFDAWDSFRTISDRNISTKIVNNPFTLSVASLNTTNTALQDFNGTVCVQIIDTISGNQLGDRSCRVWNPLQSTTYTFTALSATKNAAAKIAWKKSDLSGTFTVGSEDNATLSSDRFAIRPAAFAINAPNATAGKDFNITFTAPIFGTSTASNGYNETAGISFDVSVAEHKPACPMGTFSPALSSFSFLNGSKILTTRYNEVGVLDINISDRSKPCGSMYASVDCDDPDVSSYYTQTSDLPIGDTSGQITIIPDRFDVNATLSNFDGKEFTYLSDDLNMSAQLDLVITAKNAEGNTTKNYTSECYSKNTTLTLPHSEVPDPLTKVLYSEALSAVNTSVLKGSPWVLTFNLDLFTNGSVDPTIDLNFDRGDSLPLNPFDFTVTSATATDPDTAGTGTPLGTAKFVYGRARAYDVTTNEASAPNPIEFEVYSTVPTGYVSGMPQNVLHWYRNLNHDAANQGNVIQGGFAAGRNDIDVSLAPSNGLQIVTVTSIHDQTIHLDISPWLWYSSKYGYNYTTNCLEHPCFNYDYMDTTGAVQGVNSGTFQGSDFNMAPAQNITNKGVKVFR